MIDVSAVTDPLILGKGLRDARKQAGFTQEQVADRVGIKRTTLVAIEQGKRNLKANELQQLVQIYGVELVAYFEELDLSTPRVLSARKRVLQRVFQRVPDALAVHTLMALQLPLNELERMAATILNLLIEQEEERDESDA
jgi:transcriptional regulator with XRE-family HTH domain